MKKEQIIMNEIDKTQREVQRIYEEVIYPEVEKQIDKDEVTIKFTKDEVNRLVLFMGAFAYD